MSFDCIFFMHSLTAECVFETNNCGCMFFKKYGYNYLHKQLYCTYINVHIYCGLNALSLIFALFLFVLLLKYNTLVVIACKQFLTDCSLLCRKLSLSNFCSLYCLLFGDLCVLSDLVLSFKPKPLLLLLWKFLKQNSSFTAGVTGNVQGMERAYDAQGPTLRNRVPRLQECKKQLVNRIFPFIP